MLDMANQKIEFAEKNKAFLVGKGIEYSIFIPTMTGFNKSILDATQPVRTHFLLENFHDYSLQQQGPSHKVSTVAYLLDRQQVIESRMSLYRPMTKQGDPRMWFSGLNLIAEPDDQIAVVFYELTPYLINLSLYDIEESFFNKDRVGDFLHKVIGAVESISDELLRRLQELARSPLMATHKGDTAVGMTIEAALGILPNSDKKPDYKGIELKSARSKKTPNRSNLFAQVANWNLSKLKSSAEILDEYGYLSEGFLRLNCTVSATVKNSQGLYFHIDESADELHEMYTDGAVTSDVAVWLGSKLRERLQEKHAETFWVDAESTFINGTEHFLIKSVRHTKRPLLTQLIPLIKEGVITMDHLIKRDAKGVKEKGPLFKIHPKNLGKLFPIDRMYWL